MRVFKEHLETGIRSLLYYSCPHDAYLPMFSSSGGFILVSELVKITGKSCSCSRHRIAVCGFLSISIRSICREEGREYQRE